MMSLSSLENEWLLLQKQCEEYEKYSLVIKLTAVVMVAIGILVDKNLLLIGLLVAVLWLQDAIWKTFQQRMHARLIKIEINLAGHTSETTHREAFQLNTDFANRSERNVIIEYLQQSIRPTIAYPYPMLWAILAIAQFN